MAERVADLRQDRPIDRVMAEFLAAHERVMRLAALIWRQVGTAPLYGAEYSLADLVVCQQYGRKREHDPQLQAVLEQRSGTSRRATGKAAGANPAALSLRLREVQLPPLVLT